MTEATSMASRIELIRTCEPVVGLSYCLLYLHQVLLRVDFGRTSEPAVIDLLCLCLFHPRLSSEQALVKLPELESFCDLSNRGLL